MGRHLPLRNPHVLKSYFIITVTETSYTRILAVDDTVIMDNYVNNREFVTTANAFINVTIVGEISIAFGITITFSTVN